MGTDEARHGVAVQAGAEADSRDGDPSERQDAGACAELGRDTESRATGRRRQRRDENRRERGSRPDHRRSDRSRRPSRAAAQTRRPQDQQVAGTALAHQPRGADRRRGCRTTNPCGCRAGGRRGAGCAHRRTGAARAARVVAVELDRAMLPVLAETTARFPNVEIIAKKSATSRACRRLRRPAVQARRQSAVLHHRAHPAPLPGGRSSDRSRSS